VLVFLTNKVCSPSTGGRLERVWVEPIHPH